MKRSVERIPSVEHLCGGAVEDNAAAIDEDSEVRQEAIMALGLIGGQGPERILRRLAESATAADLQAIADALGEAADELA